MWGRTTNWSALAEQALALEEKGDYNQAREIAELILAQQAPERWRAIAALVRSGAALAELDKTWLAQVDWLTVLLAPTIHLTDGDLPEKTLEQIRQALQRADPQTLPPELRSRWAYRKLWAQVLCGEAPDDWPTRLEQLLHENPGERAWGYERLVRWHLYRLARQPERSSSELEADWQAALRASARLLVQPFVPDESGARIRHALLLFRQHHWAETRETLSRISARDRHYADALYLLGLTWFAEQRYEEAAQAWQRALLTAEPDWMRAPQVLYRLGVCHGRGLQNFAEAERYWSELLERYPQAKHEKQAALFALAALPHKNAQAEKVMAWLREATQFPLYDNPYLRLDELESMLESIWQRWMEQQRYQPAQELARLWLASVGKSSVSAKRWLALALAQDADRFWQRQAEGEELTEQELHAMRSAYREAGQWMEEITLQGPAKSSPSTLTQAQFLYQSAVWFQRAQDIPRAIRLLEQALAELEKLASSGYRSPELDALRQEVLIAAGECWQQLKLPQKSAEVLQRALLAPGPHRVRAYYQFALVLMDLGKLDEAEGALREILSVPVATQESLEYRKALSALGHLHFQREQYETAADYLNQAIVRYPPDSYSAYSLRYWMAECHRLAGKQEDRKVVAADTETRRQFHRQQKRKYLQRAAHEFEALTQGLQARGKKQPLSSELGALLRESRFALADTYFHLGEYEKSAHLYESLGRDHERQLAGLRAWFEARRSYLAANRMDDALRAIEEARRVLEQLSDEELAPTRMTRQQWVQFLEEARQNARLPALNP
ncbi:MAG: tetratricopeptide repeat protein [Gemmatales bacterium]|nr:tetratricopeptide repeat protein [Gemmatales bacterium]MDW7994107.1 tetratricopeptide repeat protein [Gemmatales bacterium]